jgi:hypothetical protein
MLSFFLDLTSNSKYVEPGGSDRKAEGGNISKVYDAVCDD